MTPKVPDWSFWGLMPKVAINDLCCLALNVDPDIRGPLLDDTFICPDSFFEDWIKEKIYVDLASFEAAFYRLQKIVIANLDLYDGSIDSYDKHSPVKTEELAINPDDFLELFNGSAIHFPDEFPKYRKQNTDSLLTKSEKSRLTQENNQLKKMFNEMVKFHYPSGISAYELAKNIRTSEPTINKYLKKADL